MDINLIKTQVDSDFREIASLEELEALRLKYLGRKGVVAQLTSSIPQLPPQERGQFGREVNQLKNKILSLFAEQEGLIAGLGREGKITPEEFALPGAVKELGHLHPLTQVTDEICAVFEAMGFSVVEGPEIESEFNNFTGLNIPLEHPSRDAFDTFYLRMPGSAQSRRPGKAGKLLLRSHTSPAQIRVMQSRRPPLAVVVPGRVYRPDAVDASHSFMFHQIEGFMVGRQIRFSDLKGALEVFAKAVFGKEIKMRFRPHFFPFTEPSAEADISCIICRGQGRAGSGQGKNCPVCHGKRWLEILGCGMIHPNVFKQVGYDPKKYAGFAFGMGVERIAMLKYGISDIRLFFQNDLRFLKQF